MTLRANEMRGQEGGWRPARARDEDRIVPLCLAYYEEDPGQVPVGADHVHRTLEAFRSEPVRGQALVLEVDGAVVGYALVVPFWSNEYGGLVGEIDEVYVAPEARGRGFGTALFDAIASGAYGAFVALALGVTSTNARARALYERVGFQATGVAMVRVIASHTQQRARPKMT